MEMKKKIIINILVSKQLLGFASKQTGRLHGNLTGTLIKRWTLKLPPQKAVDSSGVIWQLPVEEQHACISTINKIEQKMKREINKEMKKEKLVPVFVGIIEVFLGILDLTHCSLFFGFSLRETAQNPGFDLW